MKEVELEVTCIYARNYNILLRIKESDEFEDGILDQIRVLINREIRDKTEQVCESFCFKCHPAEHIDEEANHEKECLSVRQFESWVDQFCDEQFIVQQREAMMKLDQDLFERMRIEHLTFEDDIPEELTADKYLMMYKKIWSVVRHDLYKEIQKRKKELRVNEIDEKEFDKLYTAVHGRFETVRAEVWQMIMNEEIESNKAREYMQKAYVTYSTISSSAKNNSQEVSRARWADLVQ